MRPRLLKAPPLDGEFGTSAESADAETQVANEIVVSETEEPPLDGAFGTSTESADAETQVSNETVVSETEDPFLWMARSVRPQRVRI